MTEAIQRFRGEYAFLSNFWPFGFTEWTTIRFHYEDLEWRAAEYAFQWKKLRFYGANPGEIARQCAAIRMSPTPMAAKKLDNAFPIDVATWNQQRIEIMHSVLAAKFAVPELADRLLATGDAYLEEGNDFGDVYWGVSPPNSGTGRNHLGALLMRIRSEIIHERKRI